MFKSYLKIFAAVVGFVTVTISTLNVVVDPAGIYHEGRINPDGFAAALMKSPQGLWLPDDSMDERLLAKALSKYAGSKDCIVIGSSHVMQISSARKHKSLTECCQSILNLGVSGASIEDHITLAYLALQAPSKPKRIIFGVDPWLFSYGKDLRWQAYSEEYSLARVEVFGASPSLAESESAGPGWAKVTNLLNIAYTIRSIETLQRDIEKGIPKITEAPAIDATIGGEQGIILPDASHVYSRKYIQDSKNGIVPIGGGSYKTEGRLNDQDAIDDYIVLLKWVKSQGVEPVLVLTPYHENVWKAEKSHDKAALMKTEPIVRTVASTLKLRVIGSYDPKICGCLPGEFYDAMHPKAECLSRLEPE